ncbi:hypothetical protein ZWY2020_033422 [Hordeum vulgare]|nr:hypothetical protein ZWY2020_033422 [Hordeum vulgare]
MQGSRGNNARRRPVEEKWEEPERPRTPGPSIWRRASGARSGNNTWRRPLELLRRALHSEWADGLEYALLKRSPLYDYSRGEVVVVVSVVDHRSQTIKRLIGLPGDWISVRDKEEIRKIPEGHCWVEGDNGSASWDSTSTAP